MTIHRAGILVVPLLLLQGCPAPSRSPGPAPPAPVQESPAQAPLAPALRHVGRPYDVVAQDSVLVILAFRGGTLSKAGHNHVISAHDLTGTFYIPDELSAASFEMQFSVAELRIDESGLRAQEGPDFPPDIPDAAKEGTRRNMLSDALLNSAHYPTLQLSTPRLQAPTDVHTDTDGSQQGRTAADVTITIRDQAHTIQVPVQYALDATQLVASGEVTVRQSELGLTPFSAMLGALQVQDEMRIKFHVVARAASGIRGQ